uniref:NADH-ubiquinone oxidoreductase chain 4 n=1 Tax=Perkinsiella saccharicida TaxID=312347 RepID=A0A7S4YYU8_9HEMI|nr:NADH dehydrogenase subunit 4 [Perkinsiella saccharicida]QBZ38038.1 NADH dehydrogenase subunit 4 [Perkinsiella saccharicida]
MLGILMMIFFLTLVSFIMKIYMLIYLSFFLFMYMILNFNFYSFFSYISLGFGLDSYSYCMMVLTFWLYILMLLGSLNMKNLYFGILSVLTCLILLFLILCFLSLSFFMFYFYFECSVLPMFILIYGWGYQPERVYSSLYFFFYTLVSSLPLFLLILLIENLFGYLYFGCLLSFSNMYLYIFFILSFLVKLPMFFFHLWLPKAHVEAPTMGSMILAGIMLKLGGYGLIRVMFFFIDLVIFYSYIFISISLLGGLYVSFFCVLQTDLSVLIAYSSVSHMGLVICGLMSLSSYGFNGSLYLMMSHGLVSSGLFYLGGCLFDRLGSRNMFLMKGLINFMPSFMMFFFFLIISNMSCPPSLNLVSEVFICFSLLSWGKLTFLYIFFSLFFSACAMVNFFSFICHGSLSNLMFCMDGGLLREFYCFFLHLFPLYLIILNLDFFI